MSINTAPARNKTSAPRGNGNGKRGLTIALSVLGACLLLFFGGFFVGRNGLDAARADLAKSKAESARLLEQAKGETQQAKADGEGVRGQMAAEQAKMRVAEARALLYRSAVQVDRRNFGVAQNHLKRATEIISGDSMATAGFAAVQTQAIAESLKTINLTVSDDTETSRAQVLRAAEQMDTMFDALPTAETPETSEAAQTSATETEPTTPTTPTTTAPQGR